MHKYIRAMNAEEEEEEEKEEKKRALVCVCESGAVNTDKTLKYAQTTTKFTHTVISECRQQ